MNIQNELAAFLNKHLEEYDEDSNTVKVELKSNGQFELEYYTLWHNDWFDEHDGLPIFKALCQTPFSEKLLSVVITAEDEGVNGTQNWDLESLLSVQNTFENLHHFELPLNTLQNHHRIIVTHKDSYDENGGIGLLLDKCPALKTLVVPSAPGLKFFERENHVLENLTIQTGYDHQSFIKNLATSTCFKDLKSLVFRDYAETYMDDFQVNCTPYEDFLLLVQSSSLPALEAITIQDCVLDSSQTENLVSEASKNNMDLSFEKLS